MTREYILSELEQDVKEYGGEILTVDEKSAYYYTGDSPDYPDYVKFDFEEYMDDDSIKSKIIIGSKARESGIDENLILDYIKKGFPDDYKDALCTVKYIPIVFGEEDYNEVIEKIAKREFNDPQSQFSNFLMYPTVQSICDYINEEFEIDEGMVGREYWDLCSAFINAEEIYENAKGFGYDLNEEYGMGVYGTIVHEIRHVMLDTNFILPEEKYPLKLNAEYEVEEYTRDMMDKVSYDEVIINIPEDFDKEIEEERE